MDRRAIRNDIIDLIDGNLYNYVEIKPIIEKYTQEKDIEEQAIARVAILSILREMRDNEDITFADASIAITTRFAGNFNSSSGMIRSTIKYEKEKEKQLSSIHIAGNMTGNINTGKIHGNLNQENTGSTVITSEKETELKSYGIAQADIDELKAIVSTKDDKNKIVLSQ